MPVVGAQVAERVTDAGDLAAGFDDDWFASDRERLRELQFRNLRTLVERHRLDLGRFGRQGCLGAYAEVTHAGRLEVGERLEIEPSEAPHDHALRAALARVIEQHS